MPKLTDIRKVLLIGSGPTVIGQAEVSSTDGFVITAFFTTRIRQIERRRLIWQKAQP